MRADYEAMTDDEIKAVKRRLWTLRDDCTPAQDREIAAEMQRAQRVLDVRGRERAAEAQRIAAETPGAQSTNITGVPAGFGAGAHTPN